MSKRIYDPHIPYVAPIQTRFMPGKRIRIEGTVPSPAHKFHINLQCGSQNDIALQIMVHILDGFVAVNSLQYGMWGEEQRILTLPIRRAQKFEISITCKFDRYKIAINGRNYCEFPQRVHYDRISQLAIDGDVSVTLISYESVSLDELNESLRYNEQTASAPPLSNAHFASSDPPSYEAVMSDSSEKLFSYTNNTPHPSNSHFATARERSTYPTYNAASTPHPTTNLEVSSSSYPHQHTSRIRSMLPGPTVPLNVHPYPDARRTPPQPSLPPGAPIPLNAPSSNFRSIKRTSARQACRFVWAFALIVVLVVIMVVVKLQ